MYQPKPKDDKSMNIPVSVKADDSKGKPIPKKDVQDDDSKDYSWENTEEKLENDDDKEW